MSYQGAGAFKISQGDLTLALNPGAKVSADVTLFTTGRSEVAEKSGFVIDGPGEYEIKDIFIKGFLSEGIGKKVNTIYLITFEGMKLCFLGALANPALSVETLEAIEDIDILFTPVGQGTLDPASAYKLAVSLEPSVIIPMYYDKPSLDKFIKEGGSKSGVESLDKLVVKKKDLEGKEGEILILKEE